MLPLVQRPLDNPRSDQRRQAGDLRAQLLPRRIRLSLDLLASPRQERLSLLASFLLRLGLDPLGDLIRVRDDLLTLAARLGQLLLELLLHALGVPLRLVRALHALAD